MNGIQEYKRTFQLDSCYVMNQLEPRDYLPSVRVYRSVTSTRLGCSSHIIFVLLEEQILYTSRRDEYHVLKRCYRNCLHEVCHQLYHLRKLLERDHPYVFGSTFMLQSTRMIIPCWQSILCSLRSGECLLFWFKRKWFNRARARTTAA